MKFVAVLLLGCLLNSACGASIFKSFSSNDSNSALKEDAVLALNRSDFVTANAKLSKIWSREKSNEIAQLLAVSYVGLAGFDLFCIVKQAVSSISNVTLSDDDACKRGSKTSSTAGASSSSSEEGSGNQILNSLNQFVGTELTEDNEKSLQNALKILDEAPEAGSANVVFQKCLIGGIYSVPSISNLTSKIAVIQTTLSSLPTKLGVSGSSCGASSEIVAQVGKELTELIASTGKLANTMGDLEKVLGECLPASASESVNSITKQLNKIFETADKGCSISSSQTIGTYSFPSCMNEFLLSSDVVANDKVLSGCEIFVNCANGTCFN